MMDDLIEYNTVEMMVDAYNTALVEITEGFRLLEVARSRLVGAYNTTGHRHWSRFNVNPREGAVGEAASDHVASQIRRGALHSIVEKLRIQPVLSDKRWRALCKSIDEDPFDRLPEITHEGIQALVEGLAGKLGDYFAEAVEEVYALLRPNQNWRRIPLKTNSEFKVGKKVILTYSVHTSGYRTPSGVYRKGWDINGNSQQGLLALDNVFHYMDGKTRNNYGTYFGDLSDAIKASESGVGETEYFKFKCFKNGNLHVGFRRLDLVDQLNVMAGSNKLRPRDGEDAGAEGWEPAVVGAEP